MDKIDNQDLWGRFIRLGDMMGDGLHHESDGKWIERDYKRIAKILIPEIKEAEKQKRKNKAIRINQQMDVLLQTKKCSCGGQLQQKRSGTIVVYCSVCNTRYKAVSKKVNKQ
jgi:hypothetical protein